jgi:hypothetical protein
MHLYFYIRAIKEDEEHFIRDLQAQYFKGIYIDDKTQQKLDGYIQMAVRQWGGFYELAFPESAYNEVISILGRLDTYDTFMTKVGLFTLRRILKATAAPKAELVPQRITWRTTHPDIRIYVIGIRKDAYKDGVEVL